MSSSISLCYLACLGRWLILRGTEVVRCRGESLHLGLPVRAGKPGYLVTQTLCVSSSISLCYLACLGRWLILWGTEVVRCRGEFLHLGLPVRAGKPGYLVTQTLRVSSSISLCYLACLGRWLILRGTEVVRCRGEFLHLGLPVRAGKPGYLVTQTLRVSSSISLCYLVCLGRWLILRDTAKWFVVSESSSTLRLLFAQVTLVHHLGAPVPAGYLIVPPSALVTIHHSSLWILFFFVDNINFESFPFFFLVLFHTLYFKVQSHTGLAEPPLKASRHTVWYKGPRSHSLDPYTHKR